MATSKKYTVSLSFFDIDHVFKTETDSWDEAIHILETVDNALYDIPTKTQFGEAYIVSQHIEQEDFVESLQQNPVATPLYTLQEYGKGYLIVCNNPSKCDFLGTAYLQMNSSDDRSIAYWNGPLGGWVVRRKYYDDAEYFVNNLNGVEYLRNDNFVLTKHKNAYLISCRRPNECHFWRTPYLALTSSQRGPVGYWNEPLNAWVVKASNKDVAEQFVRTSNYPQLRRQTTPDVESAPQPRYMTRAARRRLDQGQ